ncbi:aminoglycoside phosphotransferase family protein [Serinibacter arcticus]|uniref:aminoglycoside phosphotransferase family protein n=1 Tax=Serinibacter arcticus TaxID=1655435 RepID=UPI001F41F85F|nr:aminoglycoside phosphotransferase family protein [Serinibacter arcticus]
MPSAQGYVAGVAKEERVLPLLAGRLPVAVPETVAVGEPGAGYPFPWSVRRWLDGETVDGAGPLDTTRLARDLGATLRTLRSLPTADGLLAGAHSFFRGCHPSVYGDEVERALVQLGDAVDQARAQEVWRRATATAWPHEAVWFHGDVAVGNLLVRDGALSALIDLGTCGVGDPACDLVMAWTFFDDEDRATFRDAADVDEATWERGRGWALWKSLVTLTGDSSPDVDGVQARALGAVLADPL